MLNITPTALTELKRLATTQPAHHTLRIGVRGGGCSGLSYILDFDAVQPTDNIIDIDGLQVAVNKAQSIYLQGVELQFADGLSNRGFTFVNPNATQTCGCGSSFAV
jgi:iron-sulfur cluster assembly protein